MGDPIVGGNVAVSCASGSGLVTTTGAAGAWTVSLASQVLPCALQVSGGTVRGIANATNYHSLAVSGGNVNITPLTDLMVANIAGSATLSTWFSGLTGGALGAINQAAIDSALTRVRSALSGLTGLAAVNPITTTFAPISGNAMDDMLSAFKTALAKGSLAHSALLATASQASFAAPTGFNTLLSQAFASTSSGGSIAIPSAPGNPVAVANSSTAISLSWSAAAGASTYSVYRSTSANVQTVSGNLVSNAAVSPLANTGLAPSTTYYFKVTASNAAGESAGSSEVSVSTQAATPVPPVNNGPTCNSAFFQSGALVRTPTSTELAAFARTYTGSEGNYGPNPGDLFVASGSASLIFSSTGVATYNGSPYAASSYCLETITGGTQLVIHADATSHFDLKADGAWSGYTPVGKVVTNTAYIPPVSQSPAGTTWTQLAPATTNGTCNSPYKGVALGGSTWVAVGDSVCVRTSSNGTDWSAGTQPFTGFGLLDVVYANGRFVAVGTGGNSLTSTDGSTWAKSTQTTNATTLYAVVWTGSKFLAAAEVSGTPNFGFNLYSSTNGSNWTAQKTTSDAKYGANSLRLTGIAVNGDTLVAVGGATTNCVAWRSTDAGLTWSFVGSNTCGITSGTHDGGFQLGSSGLGDDAARAVAYGNGKFVAVGGLGSWATSTDGIKWTTGSIDAAGFPSVGINRVVFDGTQFIAVGNKKRIYTSPDGQTWTSRNIDSAMSPNLVAGNFYGVAGSANSRLVVVGPLSSGGSGFMTSVPTPKTN